MAAPEHVFPASKLGEYTVLKDIAEGTFGVVRMAVHTVTNHVVAMKYISKAAISREKTKNRVKKEYDYMRLLKHPHIIKLYEVINTPTDVVFVLEYAGGELFNYIVQNGRMEEKRARRFFQQIISGIEYSHRLKIVHRDLKPENVLLDDGLNVKIADFGLSNEISDGDFLSTSCGSPNYAAPEVIRGAVYAGPEIDVWSSGVILYVMLCGRLPFEDEDVQVLFQKISQGTYSIPHHVSPEARSLIAAMLAVDPVKRITIPEIIDHPFFQKDLPRYLKPLPPKPFPLLGTLSSLVSPPIHPVDFEIIPEFGRVEEDVVDDLVERIAGVTKEDIKACLRRDDGINGNVVKVAYMLLRDQRRQGKDMSYYAELERDAELAALDPRNAISPGALSPSGRDVDENPFETNFAEAEDLDEYELELGGYDSNPDVLMNLQLYMVDAVNYLVDFHHKKSYKASFAQGAGQFDMAVQPAPIIDSAEKDAAKEMEVVSPIKSHDRLVLMFMRQLKNQAQSFFLPTRQAFRIKKKTGGFQSYQIKFWNGFAFDFVSSARRLNEEGISRIGQSSNGGRGLQWIVTVGPEG
ncbi:snf 1 [Lentinula edodes]|uniref:non-specific serine/threonine protein kinase n=1 Tax=Lentinula edodes TaxID=5353 RepID=A0A1Q3DUL1_LENED|nr:snf 1 [Lentinula edodes]